MLRLAVLCEASGAWVYRCAGVVCCTGDCFTGVDTTAGGVGGGGGWSVRGGRGRVRCRFVSCCLYPIYR